MTMFQEICQLSVHSLKFFFSFSVWFAFQMKVPTKIALDMKWKVCTEQREVY